MAANHDNACTLKTNMALSLNEFEKKCEDEAINKLRDQIALIKLGRGWKPSSLEPYLVLRPSYHNFPFYMPEFIFTSITETPPISSRVVKESRDRAKEVFGMLMRAGFRRESDDNVFQPCEDDLEFLKGMNPALCATLRRGTLVDFCRILHPFDSVLTQKIGYEQRPLDKQTIRSSLGRKDSIFHLHGYKIENDFKEFEDLTLRAEALVKAIFDYHNCSLPVTVQLLDGHGRMLVCIIKAIIDSGCDPDIVLRLRVFEIDDHVYRYALKLLKKVLSD